MVRELGWVELGGSGVLGAGNPEKQMGVGEGGVCCSPTSSSVGVLGVMAVAVDESPLASVLCPCLLLP